MEDSENCKGMRLSICFFAFIFILGIMFQREGNMKNQGSTGSLWDWLNGEVSSVRKLHH